MPFSQIVESFVLITRLKKESVKSFSMVIWTTDKMSITTCLIVN